MVDRVTTARLRADASQFKREIASAAAAAKALDAALGRGNISDLSRGFDTASDSASRLDSEITSLNKNKLIVAKSWNADLADVNSNLAEAGAHVHTFNDEVDDLTASTSKASGGFRSFRREMNLFDFEAGETQNRMKILTQAILALGPAAVPALAAVGAGIVALSGQLTFAVAGAATAALAFAGVGDALKALNTVALDPSTANLEKLRLAMEQLGPAGQDFVFFLQEARGELESLQNLAGAGFLPGLQEGMESLIDQMPHLESVISSVSVTLGNLAARGGEALGGNEWREFFTYLATDANQILTNMGVALGNFMQGVASIITAFGPLTSSLSGGLQSMSEAFASWAASLDESQGFRDFVNYIEGITPQLLEALQAIAEMIVALGKSTQAIQGPALNAIEGLANALTLFLESPFAGPLLALAAALGAVASASTLVALVGGSKLIKFLALVPVLAGAAAGGMKSFQVALVGANATAGAMTGVYTKAAAGIGLVALALTDLDEQVGVSNTLNFALAGSFINPLVGAAGAAGGAILDLTSAWTGFNEAMKAADATLQDDAGNLQARAADIAAIEEQGSALQKTLGTLGGAAGLGVFDLLFENDMEDEIAAKTEAMDQFKNALTEVINTAGGRPVVLDSLEEFTRAGESIAPILAEMGSSMEEMERAYAAGGVTWQVWVSNFQAASAQMESMAGRSKAVTQAISDMDNAALSTAQSASALATALDALVTPYLSVVEAQDAWTTGLHGFESALAKSTNSLKGNSEGAIKNRAAFTGQIELLVGMVKAQAEAGRGSDFLAKSLASSREELIKVGTAAGLSRKEMEGFLKAAGLTPKLIRTIFKAQGIDEAEDQARNLADSYNKLPKEVRVAIKQDGIPESERGLEKLKEKYDLTPKQLRIVAELRDNASVKIAGLRAKIRQVDKEKAMPKADMDISPMQAKAERAIGIIRQIGKERPNPQVHADTTEAEEKLAAAEKRLKNWDASEGEATATVDDNATPTINDLLAQLDYYDNYTATATITTVQRTVVQGGTRAEGGLIRGPGGPTADKAGIYALSDQEFVARAASVDKYGADAFYALNNLRADREQLRKAIGLAGGGLVGLAGGGTPGGRDTLSSGDVFSKTLRGDGTALTLKDLERSMRGLRNEARGVVKAERALRKEREQSKDLAHQIALAEKNDADKQRLQALHEQERKQSKALSAAEKELTKQRDQLSNATSKLKDREKELLSQARAISDAITAQGAIFGGEGTSITAGGILSKLKASVKDARQFREDIAVLRSRGLDEDLIGQLYEQGSTPEGVRAVHNLATASKAMLAQINRQQGRLERIGAAAGTQSVNKAGTVAGGVTVNINGPIRTTDVDRLAKQLPKEIRKALRIASSA